jgi:hypothetical protein
MVQGSGFKCGHMDTYGVQSRVWDSKELAGVLVAGGGREEASFQFGVWYSSGQSFQLRI